MQLPGVNHASPSLGKVGPQLALSRLKGRWGKMLLDKEATCKAAIDFFVPGASSTSQGPRARDLARQPAPDGPQRAAARPPGAGSPEEALRKPS